MSKKFPWAPRNESYFREVGKSVGEPESNFTVERNGILVRFAKLDGATQKGTTVSIQARFMRAHHHLFLAGHVRATLMYDTMSLG